MPRKEGPNAIAETKADDHAYQKLHFLYRVRKRKGQAMVINPALTTAYQGGTQGGRGPENNVC